jgi:hypothetical protein
MSTNQAAAAPKSGIPTFAELCADPEIAALLDFIPAVVQPRVNGWDAEAQRAFVALIAVTGSKVRAAKAIGRNPGGLDRIFDRPDGASFLSACDEAFALYRQRHGARLVQGVAHAAKRASARDEWGKELPPILPGQVLNEHGEPEDEQSYLARAEEAKDSIAHKLLRIRRMFLQEISASPGKRAAYEILTELPIDWDIAERGEPQPEELRNALAKVARSHGISDLARRRRISRPGIYKALGQDGESKTTGGQPVVRDDPLDPERDWAEADG